MLKINHVSKKFDTQIVLNDIDLEIEDGVIFGLIGPNGAGKSTLLRIIAGVYKSELGCVYLDNQKVYNEPECKRDILLISDEPYYFFDATMKSMKEFYQVWYPSFDETIYDKYVKLFHLDEHKPLSNFSKGMRRQAYIIYGLAIAPRFLLLDEAFDGLDPMMRVHFKREIARRIEEKKMSVIISSHNLEEMEDLCDSFGMLEDGDLRTAGNVVDVLDQVHKFQLAFDEVQKPEAFKELDLLSITIESRVVYLAARGDVEKITSFLETLHPLMLEVLPVNLEEVFLYEVGRKEVIM